MKLLVVISLLLGSPLALASLEDLVNDCYQRGQNLEQASRCADLRIARAIDYNSPTPQPPQKYSTIFGCTQDFNPQLIKTVIDQGGKAIRNTSLQTYRTGTQNHKARICREDAYKSNFVFADDFKTECVCSSDFNPILKLVILNQRYTEVARRNIGVYTQGVSGQKRQDCLNSVAKLNACHIQ